MQEQGKKEIRDLLVNTKIRKIMTTEVHAVDENAYLSKAEELLTGYELTHVPVVDKNKFVVGLLSHMYVYKTQAPRPFVEGELVTSPDVVIDGNAFYLKETLDKHLLKNVMKKNPLTLNSEESLAVAIHAMANKRIGCIPVVDDRRMLVGIITNQDIINFLALMMS